MDDSVATATQPSPTGGRGARCCTHDAAPPHGDGEGEAGHAHGAEWRVQLASSLGCGVVGLVAGLLLPDSVPFGVGFGAWALCYVLGGWSAAIDALASLRKLRLDVHFLMLLVALGAASLGEAAEGAVLLFLFSLSSALEGFAEARTESAIAGLLKHAPREANVVEDDGSEHRIGVDDLRAGMRIRLRPGDRVPADARVMTGVTGVDESMLTGEEMAVTRRPGEELAAGSQLVDGTVDAEVVRAPAESTLQRMVSLVLEARERRAPAQRLTDRLGSGYALAIITASAAFGLLLWASGTPGDRAFYRAMTLLVVASPCALVLSIPSAILASIAAGARRGVLFRGGAPVEQLADANVFVFDKTGTLTTGELTLRSIEVAGGWTEEEALSLAASAELGSEHPLARAVVRTARERGIEPTPSEEFRAVPGAGIEATIAGGQVLIGTREFVREGSGGRFPASWEIAEPSIRQTHVFISAGTRSAALLFEDTPRPDAADLLDRLRGAGRRLVLLSGDREGPARALAEELRIPEVHARATPERKLEFVSGLIDRGDRVVMVGDGVNDAAALAAATVSVVMGKRGSDAAIGQAGIVLAQDRFSGLVDALALSERARKIIRQNLGVSIGAMVVLAIGAIAGGLPLPVAVMGHEGSTVVVCLNSLRLLVHRRKQARLPSL